MPVKDIFTLKMTLNSMLKSENNEESNSKNDNIKIRGKISNIKFALNLSQIVDLHICQ